VCELTLPQAVKCGLPPKKRETPRNANQNKTRRRAGYKQGVSKTNKQTNKNKNQWKHSKLKEPYEMLNRTLTTIARQKKAKEKALK